MALPTRSILWWAPALITVFAVACEPERPPRPQERPAAAGARQPASSAALDPSADAFSLTYAGKNGVFADTRKPDDVPEAARGLVRVSLPGGAVAPAGTVWVTNLRTPEPDGTFALRTVPRELFEELAVGEGLSSDAPLPDGLEPPDKVAVNVGVIVYKTAWCGVCKKLMAYLDRKGIPYEAKDIETDRAAAAELQAKAKEKGMRTGSVPVIDVRGELIVGFDRKRLEKLLAS